MDEDFPNFGAAYPTTAQPAETSSWNPALRSHDASLDDEQPAPEPDDDFFDRYPGATPKKRQQHVEPAHDEDAELPVERRQSISVERVVDIRQESASPEQFARLPESSAEAAGPVSNHVHHPAEEEDGALPVDGTDDDEGEVFKAGESMHEQAQDLENYIPQVPVGERVEATQDVSEDVQQVDHASAPAAGEPDILDPEQHYEHQGELTEMEEALDESVNAPLMADEEPPAVDGNVSRQSTFGIDGTQSPRSPSTKSQVAPTHLDRSFSTNFTQPPALHPVPNQLPVSDQWPSAGDDKVFEELLGNETHRSRDAPAPQEPKAVEEQTAKAVPDQDLAAAWQAALDDDDMLDESAAKDLDPSKFFGEDDDGFLEDEPSQPTPAPAQQPRQQLQQRTQDQYRPKNVTHQSPQQSPYVAPVSQFASQSHGRGAGTPDTGLFDVYNQGQPAQQQQQSQRPTVQHAQSFVDKAKGGYQSPYDLPMEVVKPRRQPQKQAQTPSSQPAPPPRSSSFQSQAQSSSTLPEMSRNESVPFASPPPSSHSNIATPPIGSARPPSAHAPAKSSPKIDSGFFADLPMASKPRKTPAPAVAPYVPRQPPMAQQPPMAPPQTHPSRASAPAVQAPQRPAAHPTQPNLSQEQQSSAYGGLRQPERLPLLPDEPTAASTQAGPVPPAQSLRYSPNGQISNAPAQNRYSPAPTTTAPASSRYSPAPAAQPSQARTRYPPGAPPAPSGMQGPNPFAPRTSSPLAFQNDKPHPPLPSDTARSMTTSPPTLNGVPPSAAAGLSAQRPSPPSSRYSPSEPPILTPASSVGAPPQQLPPRRPRTQSPGETMKQPRLAMTPQERPMSAAGGSMMAQQPLQRPKGSLLPHRRQFSRELIFAAPQDESARDPLERWRGHPLFTWNAAGSIVSSFPKQTPFYAAGQGMPSVRCTPGDITLQDATSFLPLSERVAKFPGPLTARSKGKKKDVLAWLTGKIEDLQRQNESALLDYSTPSDLKKRTEEKLVLWQIMKIFVEHDGTLEGNPKIDEETRQVLLPNLAQMAQIAELHSPVSASLPGEPVDKQVLFQIRQALLEGQRERAVWLAEEKKLWGHAMLIASTMGGETWKQIIGSFVRSQVKSVGSDARSLAALYQVFAGNSDDSVDELVPPSARAGYQMISKADGSVPSNPLEGLDQWRETLAMVTSNRTMHDGPSLVALGKLLASYGRIEAAHTCYLFARTFVKHSGADDADAHFTLLGADHQSQEENLGSDLDTILLTEVYEWASSLSLSSTAVAYVPHLQAFKLVHGQELAAHGLKSKAQSYCEHIISAYTSTTRPSQYYHPTFTQSVNDLGTFLSQAPQDGKTGFFSKPAMNKVSSGMGTWFTKFVSGDDDRDSNASGQGARSEDMVAAPFGSVNGDSSISRSESGAELYNPMMGGVSIPGQHTPPASTFAPSSAPGRYTPMTYGAQKPLPQSGGLSPYAPQTAQDSLGITGLDQRPATAKAGSSRYAPTQTSQTLGVPRPDIARTTSDLGMPYTTASRRGSAQDPGSQGSYEPSPSLAQEPNPYAYQPFDQQAAPAEENDSEDAFARPHDLSQTSDFEPGGFDAEGGGYEPPTGAYEPPSYEPYQPDPEPEDNADVAALRPKKSFMDNADDNDDEVSNRAAALKKSKADREADEAFRKAAEADAARDKATGGDKKAGWFGGWFKGKDPNLAPGPIRAKLGEESSFYYDEQLKKWVNKKGGAEAATPAAATPPPPKGPASRIASSTMGPPSGPPSRVGSSAGLASFGSRPPTAGSGALAGGGPPSGPPSRVATPASNPDGSAMPPVLAGLNGDGSAPSSRPATSMSTASSLDDLLGGPPGAKKGGTVKGKKKGGRYVDVMAK